MKHVTMLVIVSEQDPQNWDLMNFYAAVENGEANIASRDTRRRTPNAIDAPSKSSLTVLPSDGRQRTLTWSSAMSADDFEAWRRGEICMTGCRMPTGHSGSCDVPSMFDP